jgi:DnaJ-domain-containing protein 1
MICRLWDSIRHQEGLGSCFSEVNLFLDAFHGSKPICQIHMPSPQITEDYYAILEVTQTADDITIKSSYRRLARLKHPDKNPQDPNQATAEFQLVSSCLDI